jgi:(p)ppGpp synthase/HD superfamily hydrolase
MPDPNAASASLVARALNFASLFHGSQVDKGGQPYIWHPIAVALSARAAGYSVDHQVAAILHDVVEDTEATLDLVRRAFGDVVAEVVDALTRREGDGETYRDYVKRCALHPVARVVKFYDVIHNTDPARVHPDHPNSRYSWTFEFLASEYGLKVVGPTA